MAKSTPNAEESNTAAAAALDTLGLRAMED